MQAVLRLATIAADWCIAANSASLEPAAKASDLKSPASAVDLPSSISYLIALRRKSHKERNIKIIFF
jgi:hypothetical protein